LLKLKMTQNQQIYQIFSTLQRKIHNRSELNRQISSLDTEIVQLMKSLLACSLPDPVLQSVDAMSPLSFHSAAGSILSCHPSSVDEVLSQFSHTAQFNNRSTTDRALSHQLSQSDRQFSRPPDHHLQHHQLSHISTADHALSQHVSPSPECIHSPTDAGMNDAFMQELLEAWLSNAPTETSPSTNCSNEMNWGAQDTFADTDLLELSQILDLSNTVFSPTQSVTESPPSAAVPTSKEQSKKRGPYRKRSCLPGTRICTMCGTDKTPTWRCSKSKRLVCNACGLWLKKSRQDLAPFLLPVAE
jgi:hypothetical protein